MQDLRHKGIECECRKNSTEKNVEEWNEFLKGKYMKGEAVLRIKGDMKSQNHVMRDSVLFRAVQAEHYKYKDRYKVWPMYDFYNPIEDSLMGVTLILRSNEFDLRVELQNHIKELLNLKKQVIAQYGRFNVIDFTTKGREIRELVESGELIGWDDPRLITLKALKRRGIVKEAFYELAKQTGLSKHPVNLDFDMVAAINRKIIDPIANRYSFVKNQIKLKIENSPQIKEVEVPVHPDKPEKRKVKIGKEIFISEEDAKALKGKEIRLLHLYNIKLEKTIKKGTLGATYTSTEVKDIPKINWVSEGAKAKVLMENGQWIPGLAERAVEGLKAGDEIQFERFGFCRFDNYNKKEDCYELWFSHR
jgi:glutamyl-tRNA synthetase